MPSSNPILVYGLALILISVMYLEKGEVNGAIVPSGTQQEILSHDSGYGQDAGPAPGHRFKAEITEKEKLIFGDNPNADELVRRGCCKCGDHHCCGSMCHG